MRKLEASRTAVDCTTALLASDVPCTFHGGAILAFTDRGTSTARFKFVRDVEALKIGSRATHASDGACSETHRAKQKVR